MTGTSFDKLHPRLQQLTCSFLPIHILCIFIQRLWFFHKLPLAVIQHKISIIMTKLISIITLISVVGYFSILTSCQKELSCEGCFVTNPILPIDTTKIDTTLNFPICNSCDSTKPLLLNSWSLKTNKSFICGPVDSAIFNFGTEKNSFDFWGHLKCSNDTSFRIVSFFYPLNFNNNQYNVSTKNQSLILQDRINYMNSWAGYIFRTDGTTPYQTLTVVVDTFVNSSKLMVGRFYGYAYIRNSGKTFVDGKFRFVIP